MAGNVKKFDRRTRRKYENRARKKNRRHPIERVIEIIGIGILLLIMGSVLMKSCSQEKDPNETPGKDSSSAEDSFPGTASQQETSPPAAETDPAETLPEESTTPEAEESGSEPNSEPADPLIPSTPSVWEDPLETVQSGITPFEQDHINEVRDTWTANRYYFNLTMGSLEMLLDQSRVITMTEELNALQQRYIMSNITFGAGNVIDEGSFEEKYRAFQNLIASVKNNLQGGISVSNRIIAGEYLGNCAPIQNAMGLVPATYAELADNLKHLGINLNIIPEEIAPEAGWTDCITQLHQYGVAAGIYFPSPDMEYATMQQIKDTYQPFIDAGVDYIVMSDKIFPFVTGTEPATFSSRLMQMLRKEMGFKGVLITADMTSPEIQAYIEAHEIEEPLIYAFNQGCDVMQVAEDFGWLYGILGYYYDEGLITDNGLRTSMERVLIKSHMYNCGE